MLFLWPPEHSQPEGCPQSPSAEQVAQDSCHPAGTSSWSWTLNPISKSSLNTRCKLPQKANKSQSSERYPDFGRKSAPLTLAGTVASLVSHLALYSVRCSVSSRTSQTNKHSFSNLHVSEISVSEAHMPLDSTYKSQLRVTATSYRTGGMLINQWVIIH